MDLNQNHNQNQKINICASILIKELNISKSIINTLVKNGYIEVFKQKIERDPFAKKIIKKDEKLKLTKEQEEAFKKISINEYKEFLLFGITGSR